MIFLYQNPSDLSSIDAVVSEIERTVTTLRKKIHNANDEAMVGGAMQKECIAVFNHLNDLYGRLETLVCERP